MLTITDTHKVFLAVDAIDFRSRLEGTIAICRQQLQQNPQSGHLFVFRNRKLTTIRCIIYDNGGFWFMEKRLSKGRFHHWPKVDYDSCELTATQLSHLLNDESLL
jgi:transposase